MRRRDITKQRQTEAEQKRAADDLLKADPRVCPTCGKARAKRKRKAA
jgi:hypothetical protein